MTLQANMRIESVDGQMAYASSTSVTSNTEGQIERVELRLHFGEGSPTPAQGTEFTISGSFETAPADGSGTTTAQQPADQQATTDGDTGSAPQPNA